MALKYKIDVLQALKRVGFNTSLIRRNKIFSESTLQKFRTGDTSISADNIETLCRLLNLQPGDIIEFVPDEIDN